MLDPYYGCYVFILSQLTLLTFSMNKAIEKGRKGKNGYGIVKLLRGCWRKRPSSLILGWERSRLSNFLTWKRPTSFLSVCVNSAFSIMCNFVSVVHVFCHQ
jgi:hypothetical protein